MKNQQIQKILRFRGLAFRYGLYILTSILVIFIAAFLYTFSFSFEILLQDARNDASNVTQLAISRIQNKIQPVEEVPSLLARKIEHTGEITGMLRTLQEFISENKEVYGSCIAFEPFMHDKKSYYFAPYQFEKNGEVLSKMLDGKNYDYFSQEWYTEPKKQGKATWSDPYFDKGGGDMYMCTYSVPFFLNENGQRKFAGVVTMDISLASLRAIVDTIHTFESGFGFMISKSGKIISYPDAQMINEDIGLLSEKIRDTNVRYAIRRMMQGESGFVRLRSIMEDKPSWMYYAPVTGTNWSFGLIFPSTDLLSSFISFSWRLLAIFLASVIAILIVISLISRKFTRPIKRLVEVTHRIGQGDFNAPLPAYKAKDEIMQLSNSFSLMQEELRIYISRLKETTIAKEKMQGELNVARSIQMGLLPGALPSRDDCEIFALLEPAKEVGGDLYDFIFQEDNQLYLAVGDVSGKGVPGAMFMAIARTLFRSRIGRDVTLSSIVENMNLELSRDNPNQIFVTFLTARIDLESGQMEICNAGHTQPVIIRKNGKTEKITLLGGIPLGIFETGAYTSGIISLEPGDIFLCFTDGITEAFNEAGQLFGEGNLLRFLDRKQFMHARDLADALAVEVSEFAGETEQSDDIAILVLKYKGQKPIITDSIESPRDVIRMIIRNKIEELNRIAAVLDEIAGKWAISEKIKMHINLAVEELVSNIIFYGFDDDDEHDIILRFERMDQSLVITVEDQGREFDLLSHEVTANTEAGAMDREIGGLGVHFIREVMDDVQYERKDGINRIVMIKNF